jgi:hypothetical protein
MNEAEVKHLEQAELFLREPYRKVLWDAAQWIEEHGLCQSGELFDARGRGCVLHAVTQIAPRYSETAEKAFAALEAVINPKRIDRWSDTTPPAVVIETLRRVARAP